MKTIMLLIDGDQREIAGRIQAALDGGTTVAANIRIWAGPSPKFVPISEATQAAVNFLSDYLTGGPKAVLAIQRAARVAGVRQGTLRRAKRLVNAVAVRIGGAGGYWAWELPSAGVVL